MRVAVLGGCLQGVEVVYLAQKAGWQTVVVDKDPEAPALGMADEHLIFDMNDKKQLLALMRTVDFVVPALENARALAVIDECAQAVGVTLLYDADAYALSSSKIESDRLFRQLDIPAPKPWPECGFPVMVKPSGESGSVGVSLVRDEQEWNSLMATLGRDDGWVKQEYLDGPSYSIEVIGDGNRYRTFQITEIEVDGGYDCKRVLAPSQLSPFVEKAFADSAVRIAEALNLNGIMDVEVILNKGELKVLEIDARIPSQTLITVYQSIRINILEELWRGLVNLPTMRRTATSAGRGVVYEHIRVSARRLEVCGEHIMASAGRLRRLDNFFGADEAITNYCEGKSEWVATLIITAERRETAVVKRDRVINSIIDSLGIIDYHDPVPLLPAAQPMRQEKQVIPA